MKNISFINCIIFFFGGASIQESDNPGPGIGHNLIANGTKQALNKQLTGSGTQVTF
jgi:hypothetical protein